MRLNSTRIRRSLVVTVACVLVGGSAPAVAAATPADATEKPKHEKKHAEQFGGDGRKNR